MKFVVYDDLDQLPESADLLFEQAATNSLFFSRPWYENLSAALDNEAILLACVETDGRVLAILPLIHANNIGYALKHRYTAVYSLLLAEHDRQAILVCLVEGLSRLPLTALLLEPVADNDLNLADLQSAMENAGFRHERAFRFYNWYLRVRGQSFDDYMAARPSQLRNTIARKKRKLAREQGYDIHLFIGDEVIPRMPDYYAVYNASWKAHEQYSRFVDGLVAVFSKPGWTRLAVLYVKDKPVAAQLWFVHQGKASIFRLSYDEAWKQYSPGSILMSFLMEYVIDTDRVEEIDFLFGNDAYKQDWMSDRRERVAWSCIKNTKPANWYERFVAKLKQALMIKVHR